MAVMNGQAAGGATYETGIEGAFTDPVTKKIDESKVKQFKVIATTDPIPNGMIVARGNLDPATLAKLTQAMADINTDPGRQVRTEHDPLGQGRARRRPSFRCGAQESIHSRPELAVSRSAKEVSAGPYA